MPASCFETETCAQPKKLILSCQNLLQGIKIIKDSNDIPFDIFQIERWWRELHHRLEKYFKNQLQMLFDEGYYNPDEQLDRYIE